MPQNQTTESSSRYNDLEKKSVIELITSINNEDFTVASVIKQSLPQIEKLIIAIVEQMKTGGRLFYFFVGTTVWMGELLSTEITLPSGLHDTIMV